MKLLKSCVLASVLCVSASANAQIVTIDPAAIVQWTFQIMEMKAQYEQMQKDFELAEQGFDLAQRDLESRTGNRGLGNVDYNRTLSGMTGDPRTVFNGNADSRAILEDEQVDSQSRDQQRLIEERSRMTAASRKAASQRAYQGAVSRLAQIERLMNRIDQTADEKSIQELQARINAEQAVLQNEQNQHQILMQAAQAEEALIIEQKRSYARQILSPTNSSMPGIK